MNFKQYARKLKKALLMAGYLVTKAKYDAGGNCLYCGESGRCGGWHIDTKKQNQIMGIGLDAKDYADLENKVKDKISKQIEVII